MLFNVTRILLRFFDNKLQFWPERLHIPKSVVKMANTAWEASPKQKWSKKGESKTLLM
jgi:hypothetical protein